MVWTHGTASVSATTMGPLCHPVPGALQWPSWFVGSPFIYIPPFSGGEGGSSFLLLWSSGSPQVLTETLKRCAAGAGASYPALCKQEKGQVLPKTACDLCSRHKTAWGRDNVRKCLLMEGHLRPHLTASAILQWKAEVKISNDRKGRATALIQFSSATWIFSGEWSSGETRTPGWKLPCTSIAWPYSAEKVIS